MAVNAYEVPGQVISLQAREDLSAYQFRFVGLPDTSNQVTYCGAGAKATGVLQNKPAAAGRGAAIMISGISLVTAGAAITVGAKVMSDAAGKAITATAGGSKEVLGIALQTVTADGHLVSVQIDQTGLLV